MRKREWVCEKAKQNWRFIWLFQWTPGSSKCVFIYWKCCFTVSKDREAEYIHITLHHNTALPSFTYNKHKKKEEWEESKKQTTTFWWHLNLICSCYNLVLFHSKLFGASSRYARSTFLATTALDWWVNELTVFVRPSCQVSQLKDSWFGSFRKRSS